MGEAAVIHRDYLPRLRGIFRQRFLGSYLEELFGPGYCAIASVQELQAPHCIASASFRQAEKRGKERRELVVLDACETEKTAGSAR